MDSLLNKFRKLFNSPSNDRSTGSFDAGDVISQIREQKRGQENAIEPGRRIHEIKYRNLDLFLDLDITKTYRITVNRGKERVYSFSVYCGQEEYMELEEAYRRIVAFLEGERNPVDLPDDEQLKGFYYGG